MWSPLADELVDLGDRPGATHPDPGCSQLVGQAGGHCTQAEGLQLVDGEVSQHGCIDRLIVSCQLPGGEAPLINEVVLISSRPPPLLPPHLRVDCSLKRHLNHLIVEVRNPPINFSSFRALLLAATNRRH